MRKLIFLTYNQSYFPHRFFYTYFSVSFFIPPPLAFALPFTEKILAVCAAALVAGVASAEVTSQVVGYTTVSCSANTWLICGTQFEGMDGNAITLTDLVKGAPDVTWTDDFQDQAAQIQVLNTDGTYSTYWYLADGDISDQNNPKPAWVNKDADPVTDGIGVGKGFWFTAKQDCEILLAGGVTDSAPVVKTKAGSFNLISPTFPTDFAINDPKIRWDGIEDVVWTDDFQDQAAQIQVLNTDGTYSTYWYLADGDISDQNNPKPAWVNKDVEPVTAGIGVGKGFWLIPTEKGDVDVSFPISASWDTISQD